MAVKNGDGVLCSSCRKALLGWADEISPLDRNLAMLAALCDASADSQLDGEAVAALGAAIQSYRERRTIIDFVYMGREVLTLEIVGLEEGNAAVQGELLRISSKSRRLC